MSSKLSFPSPRCMSVRGGVGAGWCGYIGAGAGGVGFRAADSRRRVSLVDRRLGVVMRPGVVVGHHHQHQQHQVVGKSGTLGCCWRASSSSSSCERSSLICSSSSASASDASVSDFSTLDLSSVSDQASLALRRRLASETLARGYLSMEAPCTVVHVVYVRRDRRVAPGVPWPMRETFGRPLFQVEGDTADHVLRDDLAHFLSLSLVAEKDVDCGVGMCEFRGTLDFESTQLDTASAAALLRECNDRSLRCRDFLGSLQLQDGTAATVRFQQFTEASALTMCIPNSAPEGRTLSPSTGEILDRLGPRFLAELPGEILLFANLAVVSRNDVLNISRNADCTTSQHFLETCVFPDGGLMCGMTGDGTGIQFVTDYNVDAYGALNVVCIHSCGTSTVGSEIVPEVFGDAQARMIQRFLEMEQYRLLALLPLEDAKVLQRRLREMDKSLSAAVARSLARTTIPDGSSDDGDPDAESVEGSDRLLLADLVALSGECEELGAIARNRLEAALAYGEVVKGRMARLQITHGGGYGTRNLAGVVLRRLEPALRTYGVTIRQLTSTTSSISRATNLLNTKVSIRVERQQSRLVKIGTVLSVLSLIAGLFEFAERTS